MRKLSFLVGCKGRKIEKGESQSTRDFRDENTFQKENR